MLSYFLCEIFQVPQLKNITNVEELVHFETKSLLYQKIYKHEMIKFNLTFAKVWYIIFEIPPSSIEVHLAQKSIKIWNDVKSIIRYIYETTFFKYIVPTNDQKSNIVTIENLFLQSTKYTDKLNDEHFVMLELFQYIKNKFQTIQELDENITLYTLFGKLIISHEKSIDSFYEKEKKCIMSNDLLNVNIYSHYELFPRYNINIEEWTSITAKDCISFQLSRDFHFLRSILSQTAVVSYDNGQVLEIILTAINEKNSEIFVFSIDKYSNIPIESNLRKVEKNVHCFNLFQYCVPRLFAKYVIYKNVQDDKKIERKGLVHNVCLSNLTKSVQHFDMVKVTFDKDEVNCIPNTIHQLPLIDNSEHYKQLCVYLLSLYFKLFLSTSDKLKYFSKASCLSYNYIVKYFIKKNLSLNATSIKETTRNTAKNCILMVDNRKNIMIIMNCLITLRNMKDPNDWHIVLVGSNASNTYFKHFFGDKITCFHHPLLEKDNFKIEDYNLILKSTMTWSNIQHFKMCLIIQDDSLVLKPGIESFLSYDFVGAPWIKCSGNEQLQLYMDKTNYVGNGGLSLRNVNSMKRICDKYEKEKNLLFNTQLQPIPEDVYFSMCSIKENLNVPSYEKAKLFAMEEDYSMDSIGIHKFWVYNPLQKVIDYFENIIA